MRGKLLILGALGVAASAATLVPILSMQQEQPAQAWVWTLPSWMAAPPVPADVVMTDALVDLGRHLFYDARLSSDGTIACASCHQQSAGFSDGRVTAIGVDGTEGRRNAPGLANVGYMPTLTWVNPHFDTLEFQALTPLFGTDPDEMGNAGREATMFAGLSADPYYEVAFPRAFPDRPGPDLFTVTRALAAFQRTLVSFDSPYDQVAYGNDPEAMSAAARRGQDLFFDHRFECYHCHAAPLFTDNIQTTRTAFPESAYHNTGLYNIGQDGAYPSGASGLAEFTGRAEDMGRFRTPSLRNVAVTAPYMHDGSIATLREVLDHYAAGGRTIPEGPHAGIGSQNPHLDPLIVGFRASDAEISDLIAFLESLTDQSFLSDPAFADPWPDGHPAMAQRQMPFPVQH
ncbi:methanobactin export MATE transporter MbnM [Pararhodobacter sp. CCB-MM2]|uniref:methanobactin export MATE transporter MbnM n=1 Tax=Pararhodobacter sp. CCB-MM2 TaxID=1786003 RepID=UPI0008328D1D|nr:methanobactin export MATE transporter MbnM [Pararhodobacter sp. CCB-MM2]